MCICCDTKYVLKKSRFKPWKIAQLLKNPPAMKETLVGKILFRRDRLPIPVLLGFPCGSAGKESACSEGDLGSVPGLWRSPGEGKGYQLQCSGLGNSMNCTVHGVTKSWTWLSNFHFHIFWEMGKTLWNNSYPCNISNSSFEKGPTHQELWWPCLVTGSPWFNCTHSP